MSERQPSETTNLDGYGQPTIEWRRVRDALAVWPPPPETFFLGTVGRDCRPHAAGIGALWYDGDFYIVSGPGTSKSRNLATNSAATLAVALKGMDVTLEGTVTRVTDAAALKTLARRFSDQGWPAEVGGDAFTAPYSAQSAGRPPYYLYRFTFHTVIALVNEAPHGATRWRFEPLDRPHRSAHRG